MNRLLVLIRVAAIAAVVAILFGILTQTSWHELSILYLFWEGIVPLVPIWLLLSPQTWRQVCPVATVNLALPHLPGRKRTPLAAKLPGSLALWMRRHGLIVAATLLWVIVPMRLVLFNTSGMATGILIIAIVAVALFMGFVMPWKSGWCASICPVYPVEKLYGAAPPLVIHDARCATDSENKNCHRCALQCADVPASDSSYWEAMQHVPAPNRVRRVREFFIGSFPGFVLAYVLLWAFAKLGSVDLISLVFVYGAFAIFMSASYALFRAFVRRGAERGNSYTRRATAITLLLALNIYYIAGADGIATVISRLAGRADLLPAFMAPILLIVMATSMAWLQRAWRTPMQAYVEW